MTANQNRKRGKRNERALAKLLGGQRVGILGQEDIKMGMFSVECKSMVEFPKRISNNMSQAERNAPDGKIPILVWHKGNQRREQDLVILRLKDWIDLHGEVKEGSHEI